MKKMHEDYKIRRRLIRALQTWDSKFYFDGISVDCTYFTTWQQIKRSIRSFLDTPKCTCYMNICSIHDTK